MYHVCMCSVSIAIVLSQSLHLYRNKFNLMLELLTVNPRSDSAINNVWYTHIDFIPTYA